MDVQLKENFVLDFKTVESDIQLKLKVKGNYGHEDQEIVVELIVKDMFDSN